MVFQVNSWEGNPVIALTLWLTMPSQSSHIGALLNFLSINVGLTPPTFACNPNLSVLPVSSMSKPFPASYLYVGAGCLALDLKPSPWLNPFGGYAFSSMANEYFRQFCQLRPDKKKILLAVACGKRVCSAL